jgi:predicted phosphodiesterase
LTKGGGRAMRYLILSDIHANLEALEAVLERSNGHYDSIVCLGDVVGYGADPNAVTDWVRANCAVVIRGNHDKVCCGLEDPSFFNPVAREAAEWTYRELTDENRAYLSALPQGPAELDDFAIVHGSLLDEDEYLLDPHDAIPQFAHATRPVVFFGHTHVQGGFFLRGEAGRIEESPLSPAELRLRPDETSLINPGSVGQPRDLVWEAGFACFDAVRNVVEFGRCPYDIGKAQGKIRAAGLPPILADRLAMGR